MDDRDRFERYRSQRSFDQRSDEHFYDAPRGRGYSHLGGAGEELYDRYRGRDYDVHRGQAAQRDWGRQLASSDERDWPRQSSSHQPLPYGARGRFTGHGPKGYKRSDERIREDVCDALMMHPDIDASDIEVRVSEGEVTITGTVRDREDKYLAERLVDAVPGVRDITNSIRTKRAQLSSERESDSASSEAQRKGTGSQGASSTRHGGPSSSRS